MTCIENTLKIIKLSLIKVGIIFLNHWLPEYPKLNAMLESFSLPGTVGNNQSKLLNLVSGTLRHI